jgi:hypothetical protein
MLAGHYAASLAAKYFAPRRSLGLAFVAAQFEDMLWAAAVFTGIEHARIVPHFLPASPFDLYDFPWTHGLVVAVIWAVLFGLLSRSIVLGLCSFSHWILDFVTHWHDLPVLRTPSLGVGLWKSQPGTFITEAALMLLGLFLYLNATERKSRAGRFAVPVLVLVLIAYDAYNVYGPAPSNIKFLTAFAEASYIFLAILAHWLDRFREPKRTALQR